MKKALKLGVALACGVLIAGCGGGGGGGGGGAANNNGGGGGGGPIASTNSFNAQAAYKSRLTNGATDNFTLSGNCAMARFEMVVTAESGFVPGWK